MKDARRAIDLIARIAKERTRVRKAKRTSRPTFVSPAERGETQFAEGGTAEIMQAALYPRIPEFYFGRPVTGWYHDLARDFPPEEAALGTRVGKPRPKEQSWRDIPFATDMDLDNQAGGPPEGA